MAFNSGNIATFSLGGTDISQYTTSVSINIERDIKDIKPIGGTAGSKLVGAYSGTISLEGGYDPALDAILAPLMLAATPATSAILFRPAGSGGSTRVFGGSAYVASYRVDTPGDDTATWRAELAVAGTITNST
jgi:hypothetical protein